jgi:geranylgeranylglycerol-phosphate geranylgeranyltransferase
MHPYLQLVRPANCLMSATAVLIAAIIAAGDATFDMIQNIAFALITVFLFTAAGNALNDYNDRKIDKLNKPYRPIPAGKIKAKNALYFAYIVFSISVFTGLLVDLEWLNFNKIPAPFVILIICLAVMISYELKFKQKGFSGNLCISFLTGALFVFGGAAVKNITIMFAFAILAFFATLGREIVKDIEDLKGDFGYRTTLPMTIGIKNSALLGGLAFVLAVIFSALPYFIKVVDIKYLFAVAIADAIFIYCAVISFSKPSVSVKTAKIGMIVALAAFITGSMV